MNDLELKKKIIEWVNSKRWMDPYAITLTCKQKIVDDRGIHHVINNYIASQNLHHFLNKLKGRFFTKHDRRRKREIQVFAVQEGGRGVRLHYHLLLDCPANISSDELNDAVVQIWSSTDWGYKEAKVQRCDANWTEYLAKFRSKCEYSMAFDWQNSIFI